MAGYVNPNGVTNTEIWNGTSWTEVADATNARYGHSGAGASNSDAMAV